MLSENGYKYLTVGQLITALEKLPVESRITPNAVRNLLILAADSETRLGFIDFIGEGSVELYDSEEESG